MIDPTPHGIKDSERFLVRQIAASQPRKIQKRLTRGYRRQFADIAATLVMTIRWPRAAKSSQEYHRKLPNR